MASANLKYVFFLVAIAFAFGAILFMWSNSALFIENLPWLVVLGLFVLMMWKWDFLLQLKDYQRVVIMRFGKVNRVGGPGWAFMVPGIEEPVIVDLRTQTVDVPRQDVITKGNIELKVDSVIYMRVKDHPQCVINSVVKIENYKDAIKLYVISSIRDVVGSMELSDVIANIGKMQEKLKIEASKIASDWGIEIVSVDFKDVDIPKPVLDSMHAEKIAIQRKLARIEGAQAHMAEIEAVKTAAANLSDKALAYYYIRALEKLGQGKATKIIFPMEISKLAEAVGARVSGSQPNNVEELFKKYAPAITSMLSRTEKRKISREVKEKD